MKTYESLDVAKIKVIDFEYSCYNYRYGNAQLIHRVVGDPAMRFVEIIVICE